MFVKGSSAGISISAMVVISAYLKIPMEWNYQVGEKEEEDLHEQEKDNFDHDKNDTINVSG